MTRTLASIKKRLANLSLNHRDEQLIALHDGYCLHLVLVEFNDSDSHTTNNPKQTTEANKFASVADEANGFIIKATTCSTHVEPAVAVELAKAQLLQKLPNIKLPKQISFATSAAVTALLDLPIDPQKPRKHSEMQALISYELESIWADLNETTNIGAVLLGRKLINEQQRHEILVELELQRSLGNGLVRFGETGLNLGFYSQADLQDSLSLQEKNVHATVDLACGWSLQNYEQDDTEQHRWLCCAIDTRYRKQWHHAFVQQGFALNEIYPLVTASSRLVHNDKQSTDTSKYTAVIECFQEYISVVHLQNQAITELYVQPIRDTKNLKVICESLINEINGTFSEITLAGFNGTDAELLSDELANLFRKPVKILSIASDHHLDPRIRNTAVAIANTTHKHGLLTLESTLPQWVSVAPKDPPPPLWKNTELYRFGVPCLLIVTALTHGVYSIVLQKNLEEKLEQLNEDYRQKIALNRQINSIHTEYNKKEQELKEIQAKVSEQDTQLAKLTDTILARTKLVSRLLKQVATSVPNTVMLESIKEPKRDSRNRFNLVAWATDNSSATQFIENLQKTIGRLQYRVVDPDIQSGIGRFGLNGYTINLWIIPVEQSEQQAENQSLNISSNNAVSLRQSFGSGL